MESLKLDNNSTQMHHYQDNGNESLGGSFDQTSFKTKNKSSSKETSQNMHNVMIQQNNTSYVMLSPIHSSHFHNLIDLLSHHSIEKSENKINNEEFNHDHSSHHKPTSDGTIGSLKPEANESESVPYFDMLYDLAMDFNQVNSEKLEKLPCKSLNISAPKNGLFQNNDENLKDKP